jgi:hypothetical protein
MSIWKRLARFFAKATKKGDCLEYRPDKFSDYINLKHPPSQYFTRKSTFLHRFVYAVWNDTPLQSHDVIMHTCDNRICINPRHLRLGTIQTNNADRMRKQRKKPK